MGARNIFGAFVIAAALFSFWPFVVGRYQQIGAMRQALAERQALVDERQQALDNFDREMDRYLTQLTSDDQDKFASMVPEHQSTAELVSALDAIANSSGVRLLEAGISEARARRGDTSAATSLQLNLGLEGSYSSFKTFLAQLERSVRLFDVQELSLSEGDTAETLNISMTANAYFLK